MGKGTIQSHLGDGLYDLQLEFNRERALAQRAKLEERFDELYYDEVPKLEADKDTAEQDLSAAEQDLNNAIESGDVEAISDAQEPYLEALQVYRLATQALSSAKLELETVSARIQSLSNIAATDSLTAWCADLTTDLSGEVGTVEVPGERDYVLIRPGHEGAASYDPARDGQIFPIKSTTPAATFYNLAMLPGWQKWRPQYRLGEITALDPDTDTCDVALDAETSSAQGLGVNQSSTLSGIPIEYMTCNAAAFEVGDRVLVEFEGQRWSGAKVVGFKSEPQACEFLFKITLNGYDCTKSQIVHIVEADGTIVDTKQTDSDGVVEFSGINVTDRYLALNYKNASDEVVFEYYQEVIDEDKDFTFGYFNETVTRTVDGYWYNDRDENISQLRMGSSYESDDLENSINLKKITVKAYDDLIVDMSTEKIDYNGNEYDARVANFGSLYIIDNQIQYIKRGNWITCTSRDEIFESKHLKYELPDRLYPLNQSGRVYPDCWHTAFYDDFWFEFNDYIVEGVTDCGCENYVETHYRLYVDLVHECKSHDTNLIDMLCLADDMGRNINLGVGFNISIETEVARETRGEYYCVCGTEGNEEWVPGPTDCISDGESFGTCEVINHYIKPVETPRDRI